MGHEGPVCDPVVNSAFRPGARVKMQIYGPFRLSTSQAASSVSKPAANAGANRLKPDATTTRTSAPVDQLDLSSAATSANRLDSASPIAGGGEIRIDRVADIRRQIADGSYDTPEKMDAALDRFLDELA
ncbi:MULTISPECIES: flagellar biosynthesis anti-sigma factor FlgM [Rhodopirellula]|jgi:anti-sigma28 factor (negative regulator of flagellin synthesis)|uniref:flagellar biosynthesis anti-sigma factor FlgM n=1 Tax=Rhodopirellula TaxID=265488 RepID=UPI000347E41F|nr:MULTISPECIES: flagellar biosynthesis anti-sigma factor FlgM [Rhodopirellula]|tara:strand:+ start:34821 stop:35207 length:387 start_codon:yes stop_codon:yes gene_type:complete